MKTRLESGSLTSIGLLAYAVFCWLLPAALIGLHLTSPSDGARLQRANLVFASQGAILSPYSNVTGPLRSGDILIAIDGISVKSRAQVFFQPVSLKPAWQVGESAEYSLLRDGQKIRVSVTQARLPLQAILAENWGALFFFLAAQAIAAFVYWQKRQDPAARVFFLWAFSGSHTYSWAFFMQASDLITGTGFWLFRLAGTGLWLIFWAATLHLLLIMPRPLLKPNYLKFKLLLLYISPFILFGVYVGAAWLYAGDVMAWWNAWSIGELIIAAVYILPIIGLMFFQYATVRSEAEKKKVRLMMYGGLISAILGMALYFLPGLLLDRPFLNANGLGLINFPFIFGIAVAIWRYHLFDIDVIIRKTLVYTLLSGLLGLVYFSGVALLQTLLTADRRPLTAGGAPSRQAPAVVIVVTTLVIAALFNPLRKRIQGFIDRRFYRQKYDTEKSLAEFAVAARNETDLDLISNKMTQVVSDTLQPEFARLWLVKSQSHQTVGSGPPEHN